MPAEAWSYGLGLYGEDGTEVGQQSVAVDWGPATEWLRLQALRRGLGGPETFQFPCSFEPVWNRTLGAPYVEGFSGRLTPGSNGASVEHVFPLQYLGPKAKEASQALVREGALKEGELFTYRGLAFHGTRETTDENDESSARVGTAGRRFSSRSLPPDVPVQRGVISERLSRAEAVGALDPLDIPVFVPGTVLDEAADLAAEAGACETGGILIGYLRQDPHEPEAFVEVTAQVPALGADADSSRLSFTPEVWSSVRAAIDLRGSEEIMVAWWHSHPVHE